MAFIDRRGHEEQRVARLHAGEFLHLLQLFGGEELRDRPLQLAFLRPRNIAEPLAAVLLDVVLALVEPRARFDADDPFDEQALDKPALFDGGGERLEGRATEEVAHVYPLQGVAEIGLVAAVGHHRIAVLDARPRRRVALPGRELRERLADDVFDDGEDFVLRGIAHLDIELVEFAGAAIGARGFVAEARGDLEILVEARDHEKLLEHLRRLGKGVELAAMDAAGHQIVARPFRRRRRQDGRLEFIEALRPHLLAEEADDVGAQDDVVVELLAPQIEVAVLEAHVFALVGLFVGHVDGRDGAGALHDEFVRFDFDLARRQVWIDRIRSAQFDFARDGDYAFQVRFLDEAEETAAGMHDDLRKPVVVAKIYEKNAAMVAKTEHPAGKAHSLAGIRRPEFVASMGSVGVHRFFLLKLTGYYTIFWRLLLANAADGAVLPVERAWRGGAPRPMRRCGKASRRPEGRRRFRQIAG